MQYRLAYRARPALEGAAITAGLLLAEHVGLYRWRGRLPLPARYALGVAAIGAGLAHACATRGETTALRDAALITAAGGALVTAAHGLRWLAHRRAERRHREDSPDAAVPRAAWIGGA